MQYKLIEQLNYELRTLLFGYPNFVFSPKPAELKNELPVFVFHTIEPQGFEAQLEYLHENGYHTLSVNEFVQGLRREKPVQPKSVLLTIDDARSSVWRYTFPLLNKYEMRATVFVIPGRTLDATECSPSLEDTWTGEISSKDLVKIDADDMRLCTWPEIRQMYASGLVDIESHTLFHREVFTGPKIVDFIDENTLFAPYNSPATPYLQNDDIGSDIRLADFYGFPLFESTPLMAGKPALKVTDDMLALCRNAHEKYHQNPQWKKSLRTNLQKHLAKGSTIFQQNGEVENVLVEDLVLAKQIIQNKLDHNAGNHLCLPYTVGSDAAIAAAKKTGMQSCFWGTVPGRRINIPGDDSFHIVRIKNDFIWRLPGKNRKSLLEIYGMKLKRRVNKESAY